MTTSWIEVDFLHCDQGMGTLVRIYDTKKKLAHLALLDLGSESGTKKYSDTAIETVISALQQMDNDGFTPTIDLLLISHQDFDHWSLLPDLLAEIQKGFPLCEVEDIVYGGLKWRAKATEAIEDWENFFGVTPVAFGKASTHYAKPGTKKVIKDIDGVKFHLMCANVPISRSAADLERNGTSAVICISFGGVNAVIPGDATADTVGWINTNVFDKWKSAGKGNPVQPCRALGAPHHGALRTIASNFISDTTKAKLDIATAFANNVSAQNVVASAGWYSKFNHPYKEVMEVLAVKAVSNSGAHDFVWYEGSKSRWLHVASDRRGIYTTVTTLTNPPTRTGWYFSIDSKGNIAFFVSWKQAEEVPFPRTDRYPAEPHEN